MVGSEYDQPACQEMETYKVTETDISKPEPSCSLKQPEPVATDNCDMGNEGKKNSTEFSGTSMPSLPIARSPIEDSSQVALPNEIKVSRQDRTVAVRNQAISGKMTDVLYVEQPPSKTGDNITQQLVANNSKQNSMQLATASKETSSQVSVALEPPQVALPNEINASRQDKTVAVRNQAISGKMTDVLYVEQPPSKIGDITTHQLVANSSKQNSMQLVTASKETSMQFSVPLEPPPCVYSPPVSAVDPSINRQQPGKTDASIPKHTGKTIEPTGDNMPHLAVQLGSNMSTTKKNVPKFRLPTKSFTNRAQTEVRLPIETQGDVVNHHLVRPPILNDYASGKGTHGGLSIESQKGGSTSQKSQSTNVQKDKATKDANKAITSKDQAIKGKERQLEMWEKTLTNREAEVALKGNQVTSAKAHMSRLQEQVTRLEAENKTLKSYVNPSGPLLHRSTEQSRVSNEVNTIRTGNNIQSITDCASHTSLQQRLSDVEFRVTNNKVSILEMKVEHLIHEKQPSQCNPPTPQGQQLPSLHQPAAMQPLCQHQHQPAPVQPQCSANLAVTPTNYHMCGQGPVLNLMGPFQPSPWLPNFAQPIFPIHPQHLVQQLIAAQAFQQCMQSKNRLRNRHGQLGMCDMFKPDYNQQQSMPIIRTQQYGLIGMP